jgi:putative hydrolase of HD superfamily
MEQKAPLPLTLLQGQPMQPLIETYFEIAQLKQLYRQGWLRRGVPAHRCESVDEHSFGVAVLAMLIAQAHFPQLDGKKVLRLALLHDIGEIYAGDIVPGDGVDRAEKARREQAAVVTVLQKLPDGERWVELWAEYEQQRTPEAQFVRQMDRLEMALQAGIYERQKLVDAAEFFEYVAPVLNREPMAGMLAELVSLRGK